MSTREDEDVWGGLEEDDFFSSVSLTEETVGSSSKVLLRVHPSPGPSTSKISTLIMSESSVGTRLSDIVEAANKKEKQLNGSTIVHVQANKRRKVYRKKKAAHKESPLQNYKYGRLWVTDITQQFWCELEMVFKYEPPPAMVGVEIIPKAEVVVGNKLHLVRELQVEKPVEVKVTNNEDRFALKVLSLLDGVLSLLKCGMTKRREIHIFGTPFNMGVYVSGIIDEIRCHPETLELEIVEFKTRMSAYMPSEAQKITHKIQVMLYKQMFDEMVSGAFSKHTVAANFKWMNLDRPLGKDVMEYSAHKEANTLAKLIDLLVDTMRGVPFISSLLVEYACQKDGSTIGYSAVEYDEEWIREKLRHSFGYWRGEREPHGVPIEESWKCIRCDYRDDCRWRKALVKKHSLKTVKEIRPPSELPPSQEEKIDPWASSVESLDTSENEISLNDSDVQIVPPAVEEENNEADDSAILFSEGHDDDTVIEH